jgi:hypothetical protein
MNRTQHLKETLLKNIQDNIKYPAVEFVLLNYGSKDDLHEWVTREMGEYLASGILKYYKADFPEVFKMSHSKNMAFKLATGDILCGLDADNFTGPGFAHYINRLFSKDKNIFLAPPWIGPDKKWWDVQGRLCIWKKDFYEFRGYDEGIVDYGYDDQDFKYRMLQAGRRKLTVRTPRFLQAIEHTDELRIGGGITSKLLAGLLLCPRSFREWDLVYLRTDNQYEGFRLLANGITINQAGEPSCDPDSRLLIRLSNFATGHYSKATAGIALHPNKGAEWELLSGRNPQQLTATDGQLYYRLHAGRLQDQLLMARACFMGKMKLMENKANQQAINQQGFGKGPVTVNLSNQQVLL